MLHSIKSLSGNHALYNLDIKMEIIPIIAIIPIQKHIASITSIISIKIYVWLVYRGSAAMIQVRGW